MTKPVFNGVYRNDHGIQVSVQRMTDEQLRMLAMVLERRTKRFMRMLNKDDE